MENISKTIILITGTNRGIGYGLVEKFCQSPDIASYEILATARSEKKGLEALSSLKTKYPSASNSLSFLQLDVTSNQSIIELKQYFEKNKKTLDILINNAAYSHCENGEEPDIEEITKKTLDINFYGPMNLSKALLPFMNPGGHIINTSSRYGIIKLLSEDKKKVLSDLNELNYEKLESLIYDFVESSKRRTWKEDGWINEKPLDNVYSLSKIFLNAFTRLFDQEIKKKGLNIKINCFHPGWCKTEMGGPNGELTYLQGAEMGYWLCKFPKERTDDNSGIFYMDYQKKEFFV